MTRDQLADFYRALLLPGDLCFDIGANVGNMTRAFLGLGAYVVSVEPLSELCDQMRSEFSKEIKVRQCVVIEGGCAPAKGYGTIRVSSDVTKSMSSMSETFYDVSRGNGDHWDTDNRLVVLTTLDALIEQHGKPQYIKIDAEGMDAGVLDGLSVQHVDLISFEYNTQPRLVEIALACVDRLITLGDYLFAMLPEGRAEFDGPALPADGIKARLIAQHRSGKYWFGDIFAGRKGAVCLPQSR